MGTGLKVTCCYGGHKREIEEQSLTQAPSIIIGTPGRLADHLRRGSIGASTIHTLVLDEYDKSLEMGFEGEMAEVLAALPAVTHRILTSATGDANVPDFVRLPDPHVLDFSVPGESKVALDTAIWHTGEKDKLEDLHDLLCRIGGRPTIIFLNHRESVARVSSYLVEHGIPCVYYHGALEQTDRDAALARFRNGSVYFLVTTDLAARGLDIAHIRYIVHYHLPVDEASFTHRNGRTARMDASGTAILMLGPDEHLPAYVPADTPEVALLPNTALPEKPQWVTLHVGSGKKDKINKVDILGFLTGVGGLRAEDVGLIEVKDFFAFAAVRRSKATQLIEAIKDQKMKGRKARVTLLKTTS
jgi:superfamily II DNA/RNA helicase